MVHPVDVWREKERGWGGGKKPNLKKSVFLFS